MGHLLGYEYDLQGLITVNYLKVVILAFTLTLITFGVAVATAPVIFTAVFVCALLVLFALTPRETGSQRRGGRWDGDANDWDGDWDLD